MADDKQKPGQDPAWFGGDGEPRFDNILKGGPTERVDVVPDEPPMQLELEPEREEAAPEVLAGDDEGKVAFRLPAKLAPNVVPAWFPRSKVPQGMRFPRGLTVTFISVPGDQTAAKGKGDRYLILWELNEADEKLAHGRGMGDGVRTVSELAKQMIRGFDGMLPSWAGPGTPDSIDQLWQDLGAKGRGLLRRLYTQINQFDEEALTDFFEKRIACVPTG